MRSPDLRVDHQHVPGDANDAAPGRRHDRPWLTPLILVFLFSIVRFGDRKAQAHSELLESSPAAGAELERPPTSVFLAFSDPLGEGSTVDLVDEGFRSIGGAAAVIDPVRPEAMTLALANLEPGVYTVQYHAVEAADGHAVDGSFSFRVLPSAATATPEPTTPPVTAVEATQAGQTELGASDVADETAGEDPRTADSPSSGIPLAAGLLLAAVVAAVVLARIVKRRATR